MVRRGAARGRIEGALHLADGVDEGGVAALVLQPVEGGAEDLEVLTRVATCARDRLALLPGIQLVKVQQVRPEHVAGDGRDVGDEDLRRGWGAGRAGAVEVRCCR